MKKIKEIPKHTYINKKGYVYLYTSYYRNEDGKSRNKSILIGKITNDNSKMFNPNQNYYDYFEIDIPKVYNDIVYNVGYSKLVDKCFEELKLNQILIAAFGYDLAEEIKVLASYLVYGEESMSYVDDYMEKEFFPNVKLITSQRTTNIFKEIMKNGTDTFFIKWIKRLVQENIFAMILHLYQHIQIGLLLLNMVIIAMEIN